MKNIKENIKIRRAIPQDSPMLSVLKQQVWISTYTDNGINNQFSNYVLSHYSVDKIKENFKNPHKVILVAFYKELMIGCVDIIFNTNCPVKLKLVGNQVEISEFYLLEKFCGQGIGEKILNACIHFSNHENFQWMWLTAYHKNVRAIKFYKKNDFKIYGKSDFKIKSESYKNYVMLRKLNDSQEIQSHK